MVWAFVLLFFALAWNPLHTQSQQAGSDWVGAYVFGQGDERVEMIAREEAGRLLGVFAGSGGVGFSFEAMIEGMRAEGVVSDLESDGQIPMQTEKGEDGIRMPCYDHSTESDKVPISPAPHFYSFSANTHLLTP